MQRMMSRISCDEYRQELEILVRAMVVGGGGGKAHQCIAEAQQRRLVRPQGCES